MPQHQPAMSGDMLSQPFGFEKLEESRQNFGLGKGLGMSGEGPDQDFIAAAILL